MPAAAIESDGAAVASFATRPGLALIGGGIPVVADGQVAGAVGVAGAMTAAEDRRIAEAAVRGAGGGPWLAAERIGVGGGELDALFLGRPSIRGLLPGTRPGAG
jgi:Haem-degrading